MKNKEMERRIAAMKLRHRNNPWRLDARGLLVPHLYEEPRPEKSYWDDVGFLGNGYRIMTWWRHPRYAYENAVSNRVWDEMPCREDGDDAGGWLSGGTKIYKKLGASRKKVAFYEMPEMSQTSRSRHDARRLREAELLRTSDISIRPSVKFEILDWCRGINLVAPVEVRNEEEVGKLAELARRLIRRETTVAEEFPDYTYTKDDWNRENPEATGVAFVDHAVNI